MRPTPSQTVGPFFTIGLEWEDGAHVVPEGTPGAVWIRGVVYDGAGEPVNDALVETWQPEGVGRAATDAAGRFAIHIAPASHVVVSVFARGLLQRLVTRIDVNEGDRFDIHLQGERETVFFDV